MKQYIEFGRKILAEGTVRSDRTGTGVISIFGAQSRFDLSKGEFPLVTTKRVHLKGIIAELLWFLEGSTDNNRLNELGAKIWDHWALQEDTTVMVDKQKFELANEYAAKLEISVQDAITRLQQADVQAHESRDFTNDGMSLIKAAGIELQRPVVVAAKGGLGPIYGQQWRNWRTPGGGSVDQISELIAGLRNKPFSRRHIVTAWNPADLPDESVSPQQNVANGRMALAPCHALVQFYVQELSLAERVSYALTKGVVAPQGYDSVEVEDFLNESSIPTKRLSCMLTQRSLDYPVGACFNIASYALLTMMVAQCVDMLPGEFIHSVGDTHVYLDQIELFKEQLEREPRALPKMTINPAIKNIFDFTIDDFTLTEYDPHPAIAYPIAI